MPAFAQEQESENVYRDLTPTEASTLVTRLLTNPSLVEKLTPAMRAQLMEAQTFQAAVQYQQKVLLEKRNAGEMLTLKRLVQNLYPADGALRKRFDEIAGFGERLEHVFATGNLEQFRKLGSSKELDSSMREIVEAQFLSFLHSRSAELIQSGNTLEALPLLAEIPKSKRTTETWELVRRAVSGLIASGSVNNPDVLEDPRVQALLADLGAKDPGSRQSMIEILAAQVRAQAKAGRLAETKRYLSLLRVYRPDPANDDVLREVILEGTGDVEKELRPELMNELKSRGELTNEVKLRLVLKGYYGPIIPALILLSLLFPVIGLAAFTFVVVQRKVRGVSMPKLPKLIRRKEKVLPGYLRPVEVEDQNSDDEYTRLLRMFHLSDNATENQIKRAYREKMKELHPDRVSQEGMEKAENSEEFRELKHAYDRIFEMRRSWFRGRKGKA